MKHPQSLMKKLLRSYSINQSMQVIRIKSDCQHCLTVEKLSEGIHSGIHKYRPNSKRPLRDKNKLEF